MKQGIHPTWHQATVTCVCGNTFTLGATQATISTDLCNECHPFFTGNQKFVDTLGRVARFQQKQASASTRDRKAKNKQKGPSKSFKDILHEQRQAL